MVLSGYTAVYFICRVKVLLGLIWGKLECVNYVLIYQNLTRCHLLKNIYFPLFFPDSDGSLAGVFCREIV